MSIRIRLASLYAGALLASLVICGTLLYREWVVEPQHERALLGLAPEDDVVVDLLQSVLWVGIPAILLGLGGGWLMMRKALEPVETLCNAVSAFNEANLGVRLPRTENGDEFDRLTRVFNEMANRLEGSFKQIREFTLRASHELKTPLTIMRGELEALIVDPLTTNHHRESVLSELQEVLRLSRIVDGLALLTKSEAGLVTLQSAPVQLDDLVRDAYNDAQILARESELIIRLSRCDPTQIFGDQERLRQMLLNLVDNAVKFNSPRGSIMMELCNNGDSVTLQISNSGPGLEPSSLNRIFEPFYRGDAAHSREVDGTGLGLAIVRWIVGSHSGTIHAQSDPGVITTLTVHLPISQELLQGTHNQPFLPIDPK